MSPPAARLFLGHILQVKQEGWFEIEVLHPVIGHSILLPVGHKDPMAHLLER